MLEKSTLEWMMWLQGLRIKARGGVREIFGLGIERVWGPRALLFIIKYMYVNSIRTGANKLSAAGSVILHRYGAGCIRLFVLVADQAQLVRLESCDSRWHSDSRVVSDRPVGSELQCDGIISPPMVEMMFYFPFSFFLSFLPSFPLSTYIITSPFA